MRSLAVTEPSILSVFSFEEVLNQFVSQAAPTRTTARSLFTQWWSTARASNQLNPPAATGPFCDNGNPGGNGTKNGFNYTCPRAEGNQVNNDPFSNPLTNPNAFLAVGAFNRFDLAPASGENCGEYRLIFAKRSGIGAAANRVFIIFEAVLPNPSPQLGLKGCMPVAEFWASLTDEPNESIRATRLKDFYFNGLKNPDPTEKDFMPVLHVDNLGADTSRATGQVRTNQFMQETWTLRQFKFEVQKLADGTRRLEMLPDTDKVNPAGLLFDSNSTHPKAAQFRAEFPKHVKDLAIADVNLFFYEPDDTFNNAQSNMESIVPPVTAAGRENHYATHFGTGPSSLRTAIQTELNRIGSTLTPDDIVARAQALSCAGCHRYSSGANLGGGITFPGTLGFTQVDETTAIIDGVERFPLSPALTDVFLPHRQKVLQDFLGGN